MKELFIRSITNIGLAALFLVASMITHILFRTYYNIKIQKMNWSWELFFEGLVKLVIVSLGTAILSTIFILFPIYLVQVDVLVDSEIVNYLNISTILLVFITPTVEYCKRNVASLKEIIDSSARESRSKNSRING